jgi:hypothetical protein
MNWRKYFILLCQLMGLCILLLKSASFASAAENTACAKFHPGMEFRVIGSNIRNQNGVATLKNILTKYDVHNFNGVVYQIDWANIEESPGVYNWSELDQVLSLVKSAGKFLRVRVQDRTFWTGCDSKFIPAYVDRDSNNTDAKVCYARIWEQNTMDAYIAVVTALAKRYAADPAFIGLTVEESALDAVTIHNDSSLNETALYPQLTRLATAVHAAAPDIQFTQYFNWPYRGNNAYFTAMADHMVAQGGGGIGWSDSRLDQEYNYTWYDLARQYHSKLLIAPSIESGANTETTIDAALVRNEAIYEMLVVRFHAHIVVWETWTPGLGADYFPEVAIPIVNNHGGAVKNTTCPYG